MSYKRPSFALRKTAFQIVINDLSESKRPSIALHFSAIAQVAGVAESSYVIDGKHICLDLSTYSTTAIGGMKTIESVAEMILHHRLRFFALS